MKIAIPPSLEVPEESPCFIAGSLPKLNLEKIINNENAISPFMPVRRMVIKIMNNGNILLFVFASFSIIEV